MKTFVLRNLRYVMLLVAVVIAVVTPTPSARTMLTILVSMTALYLLSLVAAGCLHFKRPH